MHAEIAGVSMAGISATGCWLDESDEHHDFDGMLAAKLASLFGSGSVLDLGCGPGCYVAALRKAGFECDGFDGNPNTEALSGGLCKVRDLAAPMDLGRPYDWVLSLEVGEHIPREYEAVFLENIRSHARHGVVISWGVPGQSGWGHVNLRENRVIKEYFLGHGFTNDLAEERALREAASKLWFKRTLMVFRRAASRSPATDAAAAPTNVSAAELLAALQNNRVWQDQVDDTLKSLQQSLGDIHWLLLMQRIRAIVEATVPANAAILIVGECDDELLRLPGHRAWPFPQTPSGEAASWKPVRSAEAIALVRTLRQKGADYILFPATSHWWLEHYKEFRNYLESEFKLVFQAASTCTIFALGDKAC